MLLMWDFWRNHKRKFVFTTGAVVVSFLLYKLYDARRRSVLGLGEENEEQQKANEYIKKQLQDHFESIQRISDTVTLPSAIRYLRDRITEELEPSLLTDKLLKGKDSPNLLTAEVKMGLWQNLKILSFTRTTLSIWSCTMLTLYSRVQVNILGRHLYLDMARECASSPLLDDVLTRQAEQEFLNTLDYLPNCAMRSLISVMENAASDVLKDKQLNDRFSIFQLHKTLDDIIDRFVDVVQPLRMVSCLLPENANLYRQQVALSAEANSSKKHLDSNKLEQLITETYAVLSSPEFGCLVNISLRRVAEAVAGDMTIPGNETSSGVPLARLLAQVAQLALQVLEDPAKNRFIQMIQMMPEVEQFSTIVYTNMPLYN